MKVYGRYLRYTKVYEGIWKYMKVYKVYLEILKNPLQTQTHTKACGGGGGADPIFGLGGNLWCLWFSCHFLF